jgi:hypothetical protein
MILSDINNNILLQPAAPLSEIERKFEKPNVPSPTPIDLGNGMRVVPVPMGEGFGSNIEGVYQPKAVQVKLQKDKPKYLAIVAPFIGIPRAHFYVYDEKGTLVYHELLPEEAETITVLPTTTTTEEILVGGKDTIWKFTSK